MRYKFPCNHPLNPINAEKLLATIHSIPGVLRCEYQQCTFTFLVEFDERVLSLSSLTILVSSYKCFNFNSNKQSLSLKRQLLIGLMSLITITSISFLQLPTLIVNLIQLLLFFTNIYFMKDILIDQLQFKKFTSETLLFISIFLSLAININQHHLFFHPIIIIHLSTCKSYIFTLFKQKISLIHYRYNLKQPKKCKLVKNHTSIDVDISTINVGDIILIDKNCIIPLDGTITKGFTFIDTLFLLGNKYPQQASVNSQVFALSTNLHAPIEIRVDKKYDESFYHQLQQHIDSTFLSTTVTTEETLLNRIPLLYGVSSIFIGLLNYIVTKNISSAAITIISFLVAYVGDLYLFAKELISTFLSHRANQQMIFFDSFNQVLQLKDTDIFAFYKDNVLCDKTPRVSDVMISSQMDLNEFSVLLHTLESKSKTPTSLAVMQYLKETAFQQVNNDSFKNLFKKEATYFQSSTIVNSDDIDNNTLPYTVQNTISSYHSEGKMCRLVLNNMEVLGIIAIEETILPTVKATISTLKKHQKEICACLVNNDEKAKRYLKPCNMDFIEFDMTLTKEIKMIEYCENNHKKMLFINQGFIDNQHTIVLNCGPSFLPKKAPLFVLNNDISFLTSCFSLTEQFQQEMIQIKKRTLYTQVCLIIISILPFINFSPLLIMSISLLSYLLLWKSVLPLKNINTKRYFYTIHLKDRLNKTISIDGFHVSFIDDTTILVETSSIYEINKIKNLFESLGCSISYIQQS